MKAIAEAQGGEVNSLYTTLDEILKQFYVETATEWGIELWEKELGIVARYGASLDERRRKVLAKLQGHDTATVAFIKAIAENFYSPVEIVQNVSAYSFTVRLIDPQAFIDLQDMKEAVEEVKPAHLAAVYQFWQQVLQLIDIEHSTAAVVRVMPQTSPWATVLGEPQVFFDGAAKFDGEYFFSARKTGDGPEHLIAMDVKQTVEHLFGVFTELINPLFDGMYRFDGKILFDSVPTELPVPAKQSVFVMPTVFAANGYEIINSTSTAVNHTSLSGVAAFDGRFAFDGGLSFDNALIEHPATMRVYKSGTLLEEVLI